MAIDIEAGRLRESFEAYSAIGASENGGLNRLALSDADREIRDRSIADLEAFGKAFLLPINLIVGVLAYGGRKLRLFNRLSETIVVETEKESIEAPEGIEYVMPGEE